MLHGFCKVLVKNIVPFTFEHSGNENYTIKGCCSNSNLIFKILFLMPIIIIQLMIYPTKHGSTMILQTSLYLERPTYAIQ